MGVTRWKDLPKKKSANNQGISVQLAALASGVTAGSARTAAFELKGQGTEEG